MRWLLFCIICFANISVSLTFLESLKDWLFGQETQTDVDSALSKNVKFEIVSTDEKFLQLANTLTEMSPLDSCYHIVVFNLKKKCRELTEEDMGKLAVQLLNCQSESEGRPVFKCSQDMTIGECTKDMDGTTWNSYQLVQNRARAMCYATQQEQFRRLTESTVNELVNTADGQLKTMRQLKTGQEMLHSLTSETVRKLFESQQELLGTHQQLQIAQEDVLSHVTNNVEALVKEKELIASGNEQLAEMTKNIIKKLEITAQTLTSQDKEQKDNHKKIITDLNNIHQKAQEALNKMDNSTTYLLKNHAEMMKQYDLMYENLIKINTTVAHLLSTVSVMQETLDKRIAWFGQLLGGTEDKLALLLNGGLHIGYFILVVVMAAFLQVPSPSRFLILTLVMANAVMDISYKQGQGFKYITAFIISVILGNFLYMVWRKKKSSRIFPASISATTPDIYDAAHPLTPEEIQNLTATLERLKNTINNSTYNTSLNDRGGGGDGTPMRTNMAPSTSDTVYQQPPDSSTMPEDMEHVRRFLLNNFDERHSTSTHSRSHTPQPSTSLHGQPSTSYHRHRYSRSSTPSTVSSRCHGTTRGGTPCRISSPPGEDFCHRHRPNNL